MFEELDYRVTPIGALSLRRRRLPSSPEDIYEIKLGEEFLMSSAFTQSEIALAKLGLQACDGKALDVVVGGLGLGYTARAVLEDGRVASLLVVDALDAVIDWHQTGLLPLGEGLCADDRCRFILADFFAAALSDEGFDVDQPGRRHDAIIVDIDHSPDFLLDPANAAFYAPENLKRFSRRLKPGGVFALWSNDKPDAEFCQRLQSVFEKAWVEEVTFHNPFQDVDFTQSVYLARLVV
jgi:spermidine synthase